MRTVLLGPPRNVFPPPQTVKPPSSFGRPRRSGLTTMPPNNGRVAADAARSTLISCRLSRQAEDQCRDEQDVDDIHHRALHLCHMSSSSAERVDSRGHGPLTS